MTTTSATSTSTGTSSNAAAVITSLGAGSGINVKELATSLVDAERVPRKTIIDAKITKSEANISGYSAIKYVLDNLKTAFSDLKDLSDFNSITPTNSQPTALSLSAGATSATGSHTVAITSLAKAQRNISAGFASNATAINGGVPFSLALTVHGGTPQTIEIETGFTTPAGIVATINTAGKGVTAQLINTGDAAAPYKIMVMGTTGEANDFTLSGFNTTSVTRTQGIAPVTESAAVSFANGLTNGQTATLGGLTYTATATMTATELAAAFASLASGATTGAGTATGTYSGTFTGFSTGAAAGATLTATSSTANTNVADLASSGTVAATVSTTPGSATAVTESAGITFGKGLSAGQTLTVAGLTYTSTATTTPAQLAAAFASLANGATTGAGTATGSYSGTFTGFSTGTVTGTTVTATSATASSNVADLVTTGSAVSGLDFATNLQTASNAALTVDGVAITSSTNRVEGAIYGAVLNLTATTTVGTPATLDFSRDTTAVKAKLQTLVTAYNDAISMLGVVSDPKSTVETYGATLVGSSTVGMVRSQIRAMVMGDSSSPSGGISALRDVGISIDRSGVLQIDTTKLNTALTSNFEKTVTMLSADRENQSTYSALSGGLAGDAVKKLTTLLASSGALTTQSANATTQISAYKLQLEKLETRMATLLARYTQQLGAMDSMVGQTNAMRTSLTSTFDGMMAAYTNK